MYNFDKIVVDVGVEESMNYNRTRSQLSLLSMPCCIRTFRAEIWWYIYFVMIEKCQFMSIIYFIPLFILIFAIIWHGCRVQTGNMQTQTNMEKTEFDTKRSNCKQEKNSLELVPTSTSSADGYKKSYFSNYFAERSTWQAQTPLTSYHYTRIMSNRTERVYRREPQKYLCILKGNSQTQTLQEAFARRTL